RRRESIRMRGSLLAAPTCSTVRQQYYHRGQLRAPAHRGRSEIIPVRRWSVPFFASLRFVPERVHFLERCRLQGLATIRKRPFDHSEATLKLTICGTQHRFGIGIEMTGQIDHREKEIADLGGCGPAISRGKLALDFVCLLADLGQYREGVV